MNDGLVYNRGVGLFQDEKILIVDPDRNLISALTQILQGSGYQVISSTDGEEALQLCKEALPKYVFLEGLIPKLNGIDLAKEIRKLPNGGLVSILLMSAVYSSSKFHSQIREAQIDEVIAKPFSPDLLLKKIRMLEVKFHKRAASERSSEEEFSFSGNLSEIPFIRIVLHLARSKASGTLRLQSGDSKKLITFEEGEPKFVVSNLEKECLGQVLVKKGRLTEEECARSLEMMSQMKKRQGETLIQMGLIEPFELDEALKQQAREKFSEVFSWREGEYLFVPGKTFRKELTSIDISIAQLCLRGVKEYFSLGALLEVLGPLAEDRPIFQEEGFFKLDDFKLATWDSKIARPMKQGKSLSQILGMQIARDIDVYHLFYTLLMLEVIDLKPKLKSKTMQKPIEQLLGEEQIQENQSPFEVLGVSPKAGDDEISSAYERLIRELHQRKGTGSIEERVVKKAFEVISSFQGRRDYLLRTYEEDGNLPDNAREVFKPEELLEIGKKFLDKKDFERSKRVFFEGMKLFSEYGLFCTYLGYTYFKAASLGEEISEKDRDRARKAMLKGTQLSPDEPETHYLLGRVFSIENDYENAVLAFQKVCKLQPDHKEAGAELRLLERRLEKQQNQSFIRWKR